MKGRLLRKLSSRQPQTGRKWGQTFVFLAIGLPAFIGAMGLATDAGMYYFNQYKMQTAVDAAALAGAHCLPDQTKCTASSTATRYATTNGIRSAEIVGPTVDTGANTVTVGAQRNVPYYFARLVGVIQGGVNVTATAQIGLAGVVDNPFPVGLQFCPAAAAPPCPYGVGSTFNITGFFDSPSSSPAPGNWGPIFFPNNNAVYCTSGTCSSVQSNTGCAQVKAVASQASSLIGQSVTVPLVDWSTVSGTKYMNVDGFAELTINSVTTTPGCSGTGPIINVTVTNAVVSGSIFTGGGTPPPNSGTYSEKLIS